MHEVSGLSMKRLDPYSDERLLGSAGEMDQCLYCGGPPETREHLPTRFLLDDPLPADLYKVWACRNCNNAFSADEQYLACLIDVALVGSVSDFARFRPKVRDTFEKRPGLAARLDAARRSEPTGVQWEPELERVSRVASKLAQGHAAYELSEPMFREPDQLAVFPLAQLSVEERRSFESAPEGGLWPEVGSRAMLRMVLEGPDLVDGWVVIQPGRYRYLASAAAGVLVRIVMSEYLGCEAAWNPAPD